MLMWLKGNTKEIPKLKKFDCKAIYPTHDSEEKVWVCSNKNNQLKDEINRLRDEKSIVKERSKAQEERHKVELERLCQSHGKTFKKYQEDTQKKLVKALLKLKSNLILHAQVAISLFDFSKVDFAKDNERDLAYVEQNPECHPQPDKVSIEPANQLAK
ncbi:hypothetical protein J1N35_025340 [Gossypium stocksii]|uniref:Uncharacterized protein n=1 Tax=Gossypium stocksii TaxID=47602 RepID=A0A9D3V6E1_9ROSI|nr:hypothetical protein J1N35_025340 [Gossypium stocksii]